VVPTQAVLARLVPACCGSFSSTPGVQHPLQQRADESVHAVGECFHPVLAMNPAPARGCRRQLARYCLPSRTVIYGVCVSVTGRWTSLGIRLLASNPAAPGPALPGTAIPTSRYLEVGMWAACGLSCGSSRIRMSRLGHAMALGQPGEPSLEAAMAAALLTDGKAMPPGRRPRSLCAHSAGADPFASASASILARRV
jgi:hypothetical protein